LFNLCIYDQGNGVDFEIVSNYLLFMRIILLLVNFSRTIRVVNVILLFMSYFLVYA
jgi:hypothetical protein